MKISVRDILLALVFPVLGWICIQVSDLKVAVARVEEQVKSAHTAKTGEDGHLDPKTSLTFDL